MNNIRADVVKEILIVRDNQQRVLPPAQVVVKPDHRVQIQMIGRLKRDIKDVEGADG